MILALVSLPRLSAGALLAALPAVLRHREKEETYRVYVTETLRLIAENTARLGSGGYLKARYPELISPEPEEPEESRGGEEIVARVKARLDSLCEEVGH